MPATDIAAFYLISPNEVIDLLREFHLTEFSPGVSTYQDGGIWSSSPYADRRRLVFRRFQNATIGSRFTLPAASPDAMAAQLQRLRRQLERCADYWSNDWDDGLVYVEIQVKRESQPRYAVVAIGAAPQAPNYFGPEFWALENVIQNGLPLILERQHWTAQLPGTSELVPIWAIEEFNSTDFGIAQASPTTEQTLHLANKFTRANITHAFRFDASGPTYSSNLIGSATPYKLFPDPMAAGDYLYLISSDAVTDYGPFTSALFTVVQPTSAANAVDMEYWDGSAWVDLTGFVDRTDTWQDAGLHGIYWRAPFDWEQTTVNGITGYAVRFTGNAENYSPVPQVSADPYAATFPYCNVDAEYVKGDIVARMKAVVHNYRGEKVSGENLTNRLVVGLRSLARGEDFRAFINLGDRSLPAGVTNLASGGTSIGVETGFSPSGEAIEFTPIGVDAMATRVVVTIAATHNAQYRGRFRMFLRVAQTTADPPVFTFQATIKEGLIETFTTRRVPNLYGDDTDPRWEAIDLGEVQLLADNYGGEPWTNLQILVQAEASAAGTVLLGDLVLLPTDEWSGEFRAPWVSGGVGIGNGSELHLDGVTNPKVMAMSPLKDTALEQRQARYQPITVRHPMLLPHTDQRLWFFEMGEVVAIGNSYTHYSDHSEVVQPVISKVEQYLDLRGAEEA